MGKKRIVRPFLSFVEPGDPTDPPAGGSTGNEPPSDPPAGNEPPKPGPAGNEPPKPGPTINEHGYPDNTPIKEMSPEHQVNYWKYHSRKNENLLKASVSKEEYDRVKLEADNARREKLPEAERALEDAKAAAKAEGRREALTAAAPKLIRAEIRAATAGKVTAQQIEDALEFVDERKFLDQNGDVDPAKVTRYASGLLPAAPTPPDMSGWRSGAGSSPGGNGATSTSVSAAREAALEELRSKNKK